MERKERSNLFLQGEAHDGTARVLRLHPSPHMGTSKSGLWFMPRSLSGHGVFSY